MKQGEIHASDIYDTPKIYRFRVFVLVFFPVRHPLVVRKPFLSR